MKNLKEQEYKGHKTEGNDLELLKYGGIYFEIEASSSDNCLLAQPCNSKFSACCKCLMAFYKGN
jgi:hypothetical protein